MSKKRVPAIAIVALLLVTAGCLGAIGSSTGDDSSDTENAELPDPEELLEAAIDAESAIDTVQGTQTVTMTDGEETITTTQEIWHRGQDAYRAEIVDSDEPQAFDVIVSNGTTTWMYDGTDNEAVHMNIDVGMAGEALADEFTEGFTEEMNVSIEGTDTVADRDVYVLELTAATEDALYESATMWIDQETTYPVKQETTTSIGGELTTTVAFEEITFDAEIDDEIFEFEPPADAEVRDFDDFTFEQYDTIEEADAAVPFDLPEPAVPENYTFEGVMVTENLAGWSATLQYTDSTDSWLTVTVAEELQVPVLEPDSEHVEIDGIDATIREITATERVLEWDDDDLAYTISGDLEADELIAVAESIVE